MSDTVEGRRLKSVLKELLKKYGYTYTDMAKALKLSLPTVRRYMSKDDLSVNTLVSICHWLGISFHDLVQMAENKQQFTAFFTEEQENYFLSFPHFCSYFRLLIFGFTPREIEEKHGLTAASTEVYITELEQLGLIVRVKEGQIKVNIAWPPPGWTFSGTLLEKYGPKLYYRAVDHLIAKKSSQEHASEHGLNFFCFLDCTLQLSPSTYQKYVRELVDLQKKYNRIGRQEASVKAREDMDIYTSLIGIDKFDPFTDVMGPVKNLK